MLKNPPMPLDRGAHCNQIELRLDGGVAKGLGDERGGNDLGKKR